MTPPTIDRAWRVMRERTIYTSQWVSVGMADVLQPSGELIEHHTVTMPEAAMAVVVDEARENVLLSWRHRFVPDLWNYELPGGLVEPGEAAVRTVAREIVEETGYRASSLVHLVTFEPMIGMLRSRHHVFLAEGVERIGEPVEANEGSFVWVPLARVRGLIQSGKVLNSGTLVGLLHFLAMSMGDQS